MVDEAADNEGWAQLSGLSNRILNKQPNFDVKDYGYSKFIKLIEACESSFLIDKEHLIKKKTKTIKRMCLKNNRNVADTKSPYPIKRLEVIRWFNQKSMVFNQSLS